MSGIVRSDITTSVGGASGVATGVPLDINLRVVDLSEGSAPFAGAAVYVTSLSSDMVFSDGYSLTDGRCHGVGRLPALGDARRPRVSDQPIV